MSDTNQGGFVEDREAEWLAANDDETNDAVGGETVTRGVGNGNDGPTGGSPGEARPYGAPNELSDDEIDLGDGSTHTPLDVPPANTGQFADYDALSDDDDDDNSIHIAENDGPEL
jgi:hypothetical protein